MPYSPYMSYEKRLELLEKLRERGAYVRMHAYEYLIGDGRSFYAILLLEPWNARALIKVLKRGGLIEEIERAVLKIDPGLRIEEV